jgi:hypothetical protein
VFEAGPTYFRDGSNQSFFGRGAPGEAVYFNYTLNTEGGRIVHYVEFRDIECEWPWSVTPPKITVYPGETRTLSLRIEIPRDAEIGDSISLDFWIYEWTTLHGMEWGHGSATRTFTLTVIEERGTNEGADEWDPSGMGWDGLTGGFDIVYFAISLYLILFAQALVFFLIPAQMKFRKAGN